MGFRVFLTIVLLFIFTVGANGADGGVSFWGEYFTMTCPQEGSWFVKGNVTKLNDEAAKTWKIKYVDSKDIYYCEYAISEDSKINKYHFYVQGKVCENCYEVDGFLFAMVIIGDVVMTVGVMMLIYRCTKKKNSTGSTHTSKSPGRSGGRAPPVPSPDYEQLNTRVRDTYSTVNRTG